MKYVFFDELCKDAKAIRTKVFVEEQGFKKEFDDIDDIALHLVCYINNTPAGEGRLYKSKNEGEYIIGRIAVLKEYRKLHIGTAIMNILEEKAAELGAEKILISAQTQAGKFYEKQGFEAQGDIYYDEFCPHICMTKKLKKV